MMPRKSILALLVLGFVIPMPTHAQTDDRAEECRDDSECGESPTPFTAIGACVDDSMCGETPALADSVEACQAGSECEEPAPYVLQIITSGEGSPRSSNDTEQGREDNRRVDVTLTQEVSVGEVSQEVRSAALEEGGTVWLSQDPSSLIRVLEAKAPKRVSLVDGKVDGPITFDVVNNYASFIDRLELVIWEGNGTTSEVPIVTHRLDPALYWQSWDWGALIPGIESGLQVRYALRATDSQGHVDQTSDKPLLFVEKDNGRPDLTVLPEILFSDEIDNGDEAQAGLLRESIPLQGSTVRVLGQGLEPDSGVLVNKIPVKVGQDGRIGLALLLSDGTHEIKVESLGEDNEQSTQLLTVDLDSDYLFLVGLADLTVGENTVTGSLEPLAVDEDTFGGDIFVDGRLAFYLKGKIKGKYLITAQMDSGTENIEDLFDNFHERDPRSIFRRLDPDEYYPVYGDDSQLIDDTDSQGKLYVRVDWDRSRATFGNFNTNFNGTEFAPFNRSLYGIQLKHISTKDTELGDAKHTINVFASRAESLFRHNEFLGTGGSLYYLRDNDIVEGSEKVWVEIRQVDTERVVDRIPLIEGRDYDIDEFQGRIILRRPLLSVTAQSGPSIIRDEPLRGDQTYLIVDYEYSPANFDFDDTSLGARGKKWIGDHVGVGATIVNESRDGADYTLTGTDLTLKRSDRTYVQAEFSHSEALQTSGSFLSTDGGLNFVSVESVFDDSSGNAFGVEARAALTDFYPAGIELDMAVWTKRREAGFSTANTNVDVNTTDIGMEMIARPFERIGISTRATRVDREDDSVESVLSAQIDYLATERLKLSAEVSRRNETNRLDNTSGISTVVAAKTAYELTDRLNIFGITQFSASSSGINTRNNATTLGANYSLNSKVNLTGEVSAGDRGNSALFGTEVGVSDTYSVYSNYTYSLNSGGVEKNTIVFGQRKTLSNRLKIYSEHLFSDEDSLTGYAHTIGLDQKLTEYTSFGFSGQFASFDNEGNTRVDRNTVSAGLAYQRDKTQISSKLEYRLDEGANLDTQQWVTTNRFHFRASPSLRWQGKFDASVTNDRIGIDDARFIEAGIGFAYRPVSYDRLNMLARVTYLNELQPLSQTSDPDVRSVIANTEGLYDLTRFWSVGGKLAHRNSEIRLERNQGEFIDNDATLASFRLRYKATFGIDATVAYHWLGSSATDGLRQGALLTIGRRVGDNLTFSVGYNFTSFDDDLGNDSFDARGWFFNLIGTY